MNEVSASPPRLMVVADSMEGGVGAFVQAHARYFAAGGWAVTVAAPQPAQPISGDGVSWLDLPFVKTGFNVWLVARTARRLRRYLVATRPDVVHVHGLRSLLVTLLSGVRKPFVMKHGGGRMAGQSVVTTVVRRGWTGLVPRITEEAFSVSPEPGGRWTVCLVASPRLHALDQAPASAMATVPTFLWIGRLAPPKQPDVFVRAMSAVASHQACRGVVLGTGPLEDQTRELARRLDAPVEFHGETEDIAPFLAEAWALCLFSEFEGVPFAVEEAMWSGRAVVAPPLAGIRWLAGTAAQYADDVDGAAAVLSGLCDRGSAIAWGSAAAQRIRTVVAVDAPFPLLEQAYRARLG